MAERVSASITIGGRVTADEFAELTHLIGAEGVTIEWDGDDFEPSQRVTDQPLRLCAHEVAWGRFEELEAWCVLKGVPFARWSGGYPSQWGSHRAVFTGTGVPKSYLVDEEDYTLIGRDMVKKLGTFEAVIAYFNDADMPIPPLIVEGDTDGITLTRRSDDGFGAIES